MNIATTARRAILMVTLTAIAVALGGCGVFGTHLSPSQKYEQAADAYTLATDIATAAIDRDLVSLADAEAINVIRAASLGYLAQVRAAANAPVPEDDPDGEPDEFTRALADFRRTIAALRAIVGEAANAAPPPQPRLSPLPTP